MSGASNPKIKSHLAWGSTNCSLFAGMTLPREARGMEGMVKGTEEGER